VSSSKRAESLKSGQTLQKSTALESKPDHAERSRLLAYAGCCELGARLAPQALLPGPTP
jgi:hypothetical protein